MALPTLQPYWLRNYKNRNEGLLVRRTQFEAERREAWDNNARYFNRSNVETTKQRVWGSRESYEDRWDLQGYCKFYDLNAEIRTLFFLFLPRLTISSVILQSLPLYFLYLIDPVLPLWELACFDHARSYIYIISLVTFHAISTLPQHNSTLSHSSLHKYVREICILWVVSHS